LPTIGLRNWETTVKRLAGKAVLLLEDEPFTMMVEDAVRAAEAQILSTSTCEQALQILKSRTVDVALLDLRIGSADCREVAKVLRERGTPFVASTGDILTNAFGANARLNKPYREEELRAALTNVLP
jgi:CheY-like chemotaxis protein